MKPISTNKSITDRDNELLNYYLADVRKIPLLTEEEESKLYPLLKEGDERARDKIVRSNLRFVITIAKQYQNQGVELMDLISEGNKGLILATKHFDPDRGVKFLSYATWWIRQSIIHALNMNSRIVRIPNNTLYLIHKLHKIIDQYVQEFERKPSLDELAEISNLDIETVIALLSTKKKCVSLDTPFENANDDAGCLLDVVPNEDIDIEKELINKEILVELQRCVDLLPIREKAIIQLYFGMYSKSMSLDDIGEKFGLTAERVRQIKDDAIAIIKDNFKYE